MRWTWNEAKNRANKQKHGLSFETARLVFNDPLSVSRCDQYPDEERWQTIGFINGVIVFVVHTYPTYEQESEEEIGRIISARKATKYERRIYEQGEF